MPSWHCALLTSVLSLLLCMCSSACAARVRVRTGPDGGGNAATGVVELVGVDGRGCELQATGQRDGGEFVAESCLLAGTAIKKIVITPRGTARWAIDGVDVDEGAGWGAWWAELWGGGTAHLNPTEASTLLAFRRSATYTRRPPGNTHTLSARLTHAADADAFTAAAVSVVFINSDARSGEGGAAQSCIVRLREAALSRDAQVVQSAPACPFPPGSVTSVQVLCHSFTDALALGALEVATTASDAVPGWTACVPAEGEGAALPIVGADPAEWLIVPSTPMPRVDNSTGGPLMSPALRTMSTAAGIAVFASGGFSAASLARVGLLRHASLCTNSDRSHGFWDLGWELYPAAVPIGSAVERHVVGAVVGNPLTLVALAFVISTITCMSHWTIVLFFRYPGCLYAPYLFLLHGTTYAAGRQVFYAHISDDSIRAYLLGGGVLLACIAAPVYVHVRVVRDVRQKACMRNDTRMAIPIDSSTGVLLNAVECVEGDDATTSAAQDETVEGADVPETYLGWRRAWWMCAFGSEFWISQDGHFCEQKGKVFEVLTPRAHWYFVSADQVCTLLVSAATAWCPPEGSVDLTTRNAVIALVLLAQFVMLLAVRSYLATMDNLAAALMSALLGVCAVLGMFKSEGSDVDAQVIADLLSATLAVILAKAVWDLMVFLVDRRVQRRWQARQADKQHLQGNQLFEFDGGGGKKRVLIDTDGGRDVYGIKTAKSADSKDAVTSATQDAERDEKEDIEVKDDINTPTVAAPKRKRRDHYQKTPLADLVMYRFTSDTPDHSSPSDDGDESVVMLQSYSTGRSLSKADPDKLRQFKPGQLRKGAKVISQGRLDTSCMAPRRAATQSSLRDGIINGAFTNDFPQPAPGLQKSATFRRRPEGLSPHRTRLVNFFRHHDAERVKDVDVLLFKHRGEETAMFEMLVAQYGEEPGVVTYTGGNDAEANGSSLVLTVEGSAQDINAVRVRSSTLRRAGRGAGSPFNTSGSMRKTTPSRDDVSTAGAGDESFVMPEPVAPPSLRESGEMPRHSIRSTALRTRTRGAGVEMSPNLRAGHDTFPSPHAALRQQRSPVSVAPLSRSNLRARNKAAGSATDSSVVLDVPPSPVKVLLPRATSGTLEMPPLFPNRAAQRRKSYDVAVSTTANSDAMSSPRESVLDASIPSNFEEVMNTPETRAQLPRRSETSPQLRAVVGVGRPSSPLQGTLPPPQRRVRPEAWRSPTSPTKPPTSPTRPPASPTARRRPGSLRLHPFAASEETGPPQAEE